MSSFSGFWSSTCKCLDHQDSQDHLLLLLRLLSTNKRQTKRLQDKHKTRLQDSTKHKRTTQNDNYQTVNS